MWENMKGRRGLYCVAMIGTIVYNVMQLTVPYFSGRIVDLFLDTEFLGGRHANRVAMVMALEDK